MGVGRGARSRRWLRRSLTAGLTIAVAAVGLTVLVEADPPGATAPIDAPWVCGSAGGAFHVPHVAKSDPDAGATRYAKVWVPSGATVSVSSIGSVDAQSFFGWFYAQEIFYSGIRELDNTTTVASNSWLHQPDGPSVFTHIWGPYTLSSWTNTGTSREMLIYSRSELFVAAASESTTTVTVTGGYGRDRGCVDERTKRGKDLESVPAIEDPVNLFTGSFTDSWTDLLSPLGTWGLEWERFYDSGGTAGAAMVGYSFSDHLEELVSGVVEVTLPDSRVVVFFPDGSSGYERPSDYPGQLSAI